MVAGPQERPSGNTRPAAARRVCVGWGAGAASMAGAARFRFASGLRAAACVLRPLCCRFPPRGAATAGAPFRWGSRWRFAAAYGERRAGFAAKPHFKKGRSPCLGGAAERRRGMVRRRALRTAIRPAQGPRVTRCYRWRSPGAPDGKKEGVPTGHSLLFADKGRPADGRSGLELSPAPTGQSSIYRTRAAPWGDNTGARPLYPGGYFM